jgi:hypothetical protein
MELFIGITSAIFIQTSSSRGVWRAHEKEVHGLPGEVHPHQGPSGHAIDILNQDPGTTLMLILQKVQAIPDLVRDINLLPG